VGTNYAPLLVSTSDPKATSETAPFQLDLGWVSVYQLSSKIKERLKTGRVRGGASDHSSSYYELGSARQLLFVPFDRRS
jgi:hypothetical protein